MQDPSNRARDTFYWPGINHETTYLVANCETCITFRNCYQKETLIPHVIPSSPWIKIGTDVFHLKNKYCLIVDDYHSKFFEVSLLPDMHSSTVIKKTKEVFARHGILRMVFGDSGPEFDSLEYKDFSKGWEFVHDTSSPNFLQSNGQVERTIQTVKRTLKKAAALDTH